MKLKKIIQDSTHTNALYQHILPREELIRQVKELKKSVYKIDETMRDKMPKKRESTGLLEDQSEYTKELLILKKRRKIYNNTSNKRKNKDVRRNNE